MCIVLPDVTRCSTIFIFSAGSDILATTDDAKWTIGHMAASNGQLAALQYLIEAGIDVNSKGGAEHSSSLLHEAAHMGHSDCVRLLLSSGNVTIGNTSSLPQINCVLLIAAAILIPFGLYFILDRSVRPF